MKSFLKPVAVNLSSKNGSRQFKTALRLDSEENIFQKAGIHFIPPPLREDPAIIEKAHSCGITAADSIFRHKRYYS